MWHFGWSFGGMGVALGQWVGMVLGWVVGWFGGLSLVSLGLFVILYMGCDAFEGPCLPSELGASSFVLNAFWHWFVGIMSQENKKKKKKSSRGISYI